MGIMFIALGIIVGLEVSTFPSSSFFGPSLFPGLITIGILLCGALLVSRAVRSNSSGHYTVQFFGPIKSKRAGLYATLIVLTSSCYAFLGDVIGFQVITLIWLFSLHMLLRRRIIMSLVSAFLITFIFDFVFRHVLHVPLPSGILTGLLY